MDPETGANAVAHLDHNLGTKNRQWTMSLSTAEYLCAADTPGGFCNKKLQRALVTLRNRPTTWEGWSHGKRSKLLRTVLTAACEEYKATGPHAPAISFHATAVAKRVLRQDGPKPLSALAGTPLVLVNCSDAPDIRDWQTWSVAHRCRGGLKTCSSPYSVLSLRGPSRALGRAGIRDGLCLAIAGTRSARQPYAVLAALAPCNEVEDVASSAGRSSPGQLRGELSFSNGEAFVRGGKFAPTAPTEGAELLVSSADVGALRAGLPEHQTDCGFWSDCTGVRVVLPKPCWKLLVNDTRACGDAEPMIISILKRMQENLDAGMKSMKKDLRDGFVLGPAGPVRRRALGTKGDNDHLCMSTWRATFAEGAPVTFGRCPRFNPKKKWASSSNFEWLRVSVDNAAIGGRHRLYRSASSSIKLSPVKAPHLCVAAPTLLPSP
mmetsp:Transcript_3186/g.9757  ORF Transcript_3186/g.9757 Transcript_3186/m.9757 type:complete len:435 (+) Transcript_3186:808-2112(+)